MFPNFQGLSRVCHQQLGDHVGGFIKFDLMECQVSNNALNTQIRLLSHDKELHSQLYQVSRCPSQLSNAFKGLFYGQNRCHSQQIRILLMRDEGIHVVKALYRAGGPISKGLERLEKNTTFVNAMQGFDIYRSS